MEHILFGLTEAVVVPNFLKCPHMALPVFPNYQSVING